MRMTEAQIRQRLGTARAAYMRRPGALPDEAWVAQVMCRVRAERAPLAIPFPRLEKAVWRAAAAAAALALLAGIAAVKVQMPDTAVTWELATARTQYEWLIATKE
jgi:hypothetical protein